MSNASLPILTYSVDQRFFVESLGGQYSSQNFLNRFPDAVYNKAIDSHLVNFLYALLGPAGAGLLREQYLLARLQLEESNVTGADLDSLYSSPFKFARLAQETYIIDASASLLPAVQRAQILSYDASFRNRAQLWLQAIRAGGTVRGITLAASSGLAQPVEVIENYKALYDQFCDIPLGLPYMGTSASLNEIILVPRNSTPQSSQQSFILTNEPRIGYFTITLPFGSPCTQITPCTTSAPGNVLTVPQSSQFSSGAYVTVATLGGNVYTVVDQILDPSTITLVDVVTGAPVSLPGSSVFIVQLGTSQTRPIPFNATYDVIEEAIGAVPCIGGQSNVQVTGGPLPDQFINVIFTGALANVEVGPIQINVGTDEITGVGINSETPAMLDVHGTADIDGFLIQDIVGVEADGLYIQFAPGDVQDMLYAVDILRPATSFVTTTIGQSITQRQPANTTFASTNYTEVLRYVTGDVHVPWPRLDGKTNWIEAGLEHEAPTPSNSLSSQYVNFHNILDVTAYTDEALEDAHYGDPQNSDVQPFYAKYFNTHIGSFNQAQQALYPFLSAYQNTNYQFGPNFAPNAQPDRPAITGTVGDPIGLINNTYPVTYLGLPGVTQQVLGMGVFYASVEAVSGVDYLEIDLGTVQAVNYLYFEATNKPYSIDVAYDLMDMAPNRSFAPVQVFSVANAPSITSLDFVAGETSPWTPVTISVLNGMGQMIYTRFIRIGFTRNASGPPFQLGGIPATSIPYSIEVRNLRVGRNVVSGGSAGSAVNGLSSSGVVRKLTGPVAGFTFTSELVPT